MTVLAAGREWGWQWVFPATRIEVDREPASAPAATSTNPYSSGQ